MANRVCADVNQRPFARVNVRAHELSEYIIKHEQFKIDDSPVTPVGNIWEYTTLSMENGKEYGGEITFCFDTGKLTAGLHLASITIPDFDGVEHTYSWAFRYDPNEPTSDPNILQTIAILPSDTPPATAVSTTPSPRSITIIVLNDLATGTPLPGVFEIEPFVERYGEGFSIWTNESNFWEPGDTAASLNNLDIRVEVEEKVFTGDNLFVFWRNSSVQEVKNDKGEVIGSYLWSPMSIGFSTRDLDLGTHSATIKVTTTSGKVYSDTWSFRIDPYTRQNLNPEMLPTAEFLEQNPLPTPSFVTYLGTSSTYLDHFVCFGPSSEGLFFTLDKASFGDLKQAEAKLQVFVDGQRQSSDNLFFSDTDYGSYRVCVLTGKLDYGLHIATIQLNGIDKELTYSWTFRIENPSLAVTPTPTP